MNRYIISTVFLCSLFSGVAQASQEALQLGVCLTDSLNGKERKNLAKWIYLGMSSHSVIKPYSNVSAKDLDTSDQYMGELITRLITEDCPKQAKAASKISGNAAFEQAFSVVGEVAMQELMTEPSVGKSLGAFEKYLDQEKFNKTFK
ncbi:hypothetical protein F0236_17315 [Vibrio splendidus]|uniref:hypothetical protein n=1 Tax=Vibrio splendidus TaxID=29497 RepID=UPI00148CA62A|nr:hypothetical protein [Vibrio splendidus]NOJ05505.1 hypothetical protein [Vibrio splendidus]